MVGSRPFSLALLLLALLPASAAANSTTGIIVKRDAGLSAAERADIRAHADVRLVETLSIPRTEVVAAQPGDVEDAMRDLNADPDVVYAQRNERRGIVADPGLPDQWGLQNVAQWLFEGDASSKGTYDADSDVVEAWALATGVGQTVAVVDSGIVNHEDLAGQIVAAANFVDEDGTDTTDGNAHGTHVAGTIAALRGNAFGGAGVAPGAKIMALRVLDDDGRGWDDDIAEGLDYAGDQGIKVVNVSIGGGGLEPPQVLEDAIAAHPETLYVIAAGNSNRNNDVTHTWPCDLDEPNIICVGASTNRDERARFSNWGDENVDLFAPGESILSTIPAGVIEDFPADVKYAYFDGTSMAAPHVAGAAALALAADPTLAVAGLKGVLLDSVDLKASFNGLSATGGRLNAGVAVAWALAGREPDDTDGDDVYDAVDRCPAVSDPGPEGCPLQDQDNDLVADYDDNCKTIGNANQADLDGDFLGDVCDGDDDGDTRGDLSDNCPVVANLTQRDLDGDKAGDACDSDRDGDGRENSADVCPDVYAETSNGCTADPVVPPPADSDGDGRYDASDACPTEYAITANGCPVSQVASVSAKARRGKATVRVVTSRQATVRVTVERKRGGKWVRVTRKTLVTSGNRATLTVSRLKRGAYRARISVSSSAGRGTPVTKAFRVR